MKLGRRKLNFSVPYININITSVPKWHNLHKLGYVKEILTTFTDQNVNISKGF